MLRRSCRTVAAAVAASAGIAACLSSPDPAPEPGPAQAVRQPLADALATDVLADAPWRVQSDDTIIPFGVVVADAAPTLGETRLNTVTIRLMDPNGDRTVYHRDFGGLLLSDDPFTKTVWYLHVRNFRASSFEDGTPITAAALTGGPAAGKTLAFSVEIDADVYARASLNRVVLRVHVGQAPLPHGSGLFAGWLAGDTHNHTLYTHNWAEFGPPHRAIAWAARSIGLDWAITTDHSCDMDPTFSTVAGDLSRRVEQYTFCDGDQAPQDCTRRDNSAFWNGWEMADSDAKEAEKWAGTPLFRFHTGEEVNVLSATGKTLHMMAVQAGYVQSIGSGADMYGVKDPVTLELADALAQMPDEGMAFAAHPRQPLPSPINGGAWEEADVLQAVASPRFLGFELWNLRMRRSAAVKDPYQPGGLDPFASWQSCDAADPECLGYLPDAIAWWDGWLSRMLATSGKRLLIVGGSDAHGDWNYHTASSTGVKLDKALDSALGKVRTVVLPQSSSMDDILAAVRAGRAVVTDGPMMTFGVDGTGDGSIDQMQDTHPGSLIGHAPSDALPLVFKWQSTPEFGALTSLRLLRGSSSTGAAPVVYDAIVDSDKLGNCPSQPLMAGTCVLTLKAGSSVGPPALGETVYYRAIAASQSDDEYRCLTNPIWVQGATPQPEPQPEAGADAQEAEAGGDEPEVLPEAAPVEAEADGEPVEVPVGDPGDSGGCGCSMPGAPAGRSIWIAALAALVWGRARSRRCSPRPGGALR